MNQLAKLDKTKYNPDKPNYQQGDDWDWIFKEYNKYQRAAWRRNGKWSSLQRWIREKSIPAPRLNNKNTFD